MKIAAASSDGVNVDLHFGQAKTLVTFEISESGELSGQGSLPGLSGCICDNGEEFDTDGFVKSFEGISYLITLKTGPHFHSAFTAAGVTVLDAGCKISDAAFKIAAYEAKRRMKRSAAGNAAPPMAGGFAKQASANLGKEE